MKLVALTDVCDFQGGTQPPKSDWIKGPSDQHIRMLQIRDFTQPDKDNIEYVKKTRKLKLCNEDDILIGRYGASIGKILTGLSGAYNVAIIKTIPNKELLSKKFLFHLLKGPRFQAFINAIGARAAQAGFNKTDLSKFIFPLLSFDDQIRIATLLSRIETLIAARKDNLRLLDEFLKSTFLEMFGDPVRNEKGFDFSLLNTFITHLTSGARGWAKYYAKSGKRFIRSLDVQMNKIGDEDIVFVNPPKNQESERTKTQENDVLLTITGSKIGRAAYVPKDFEEAYISQHVSIIRTQGINPIYLSYYLSMPNAGQRIIKKCSMDKQNPV